MRVKGKVEIKIMLLFITALGATLLKTKEILKKVAVAILVVLMRKNFLK
jgi:hypothetical protein